MDEFTFINSIKQLHYRQPSLIKGIGDDAAVFRQSQKDIVTAVDMFVEDVHFSKNTMRPEQIGYRILAANLSDLAAMEACPAFYLVSIAIPKEWEHNIDKVFKGMSQFASRYKMDLIGGDTVSGEKLTISITVIGYVEQGKARYRSSANSGDIVFATGTLGDSRAGLYLLKNETTYQNKSYFIKRHQEPTPQISFSQNLQSINRIALNDISDGIVSEAAEIASASKVNIILREESIPVNKHFNQFPNHLQLEWKLFGGEDFELLGVVSPEDWLKVQDAGKKTNTRTTKVGYVTDGIGQIYLSKKGKKQLITKRGYTHLT